MVEYDRTCPECREEFKAKRKDKVFCSDLCRVNNHRRNKEIVYTTCRKCGEVFPRKRTDPIKLYCSPICLENKRESQMIKAHRNYYKKSKGTKRTEHIGTSTLKRDEIAIIDNDPDFSTEFKKVRKMLKSTFKK